MKNTKSIKLLSYTLDINSFIHENDSLNKFISFEAPRHFCQKKPKYAGQLKGHCN